MLSSERAASGIVLVLDPDDAGLRAAEKNGKNLLDLFSDWGEARYPSEPTSMAIAECQRAIDDLAEQIQAIDAAGGDSLAQSEMRFILFEYMDELRRTERVTLYSKCHTADEFIAADAIENNPILPKHGKIDYAAIKKRVDIVDYISRHAELKRRGKNLVTKCTLPDHQDDTASMYIYPKTKSFYCFGCSRGGDVIEYARLRGIGAREIA
jgi:hypothetical protein